MKINSNKCIQCKKCIPYCPVGAIGFHTNIVSIDQDRCVECGVCFRSKVCPKDALMPFNRNNWFVKKGKIEELYYKVINKIKKFFPKLWRFEHPRKVREIFSNPTSICSFTGTYGRGTEEVKTNDVTGRIKEGELGFCFEVGRPGVGATLEEIEPFITGLAKIGVSFEKENPINYLIKNSEGYLKDKYLKERVLSAIIEFKIREDEIEPILDFVRRMDKITKTVFTVGVVSPIKNGEVKEFLFEGFTPLCNSKVNLGLGRVPKGETS